MMALEVLIQKLRAEEEFMEGATASSIRSEILGREIGIFTEIATQRLALETDIEQKFVKLVSNWLVWKDRWIVQTRRLRMRWARIS
jgi:hypothetical protein